MSPGDAPLLRVESIGSTNDELVRLAHLGAVDGTALVAATQTGGHGRRGRSWQGLPGGHIYLSLLHRSRLPAARLAGLTLDIGAAVAGVLEGYGLHPGLKWPNDLQLDGAKVGGILCELVDPERAPAVVIGLGLNVDACPLPAELAHATTLGAHLGPDTPSVEALTPRLVDALRAACRADDARGGPDLDGWTRRAGGLGRRVRDLDPVATRAGVITGVAADGALLVHWDGAPAPERFVAGDLALADPPRETA